MACGRSAKVGEWVEVRPLAEIMATLDERCALEAMPFLPEMAQFAGRRFQIFRSAHKTCDPTGATDLRRVPDAVHLGTRCDGSAHDGCEARCLLFWKRAWLRPVDGPASGTAPPPPTPGGDLERLEAATRTAESGELRYRCQATEIVAASTRLPVSEVRQYFEDVATRNVSPVQLVVEFLRIYARAVVNKVFRIAPGGGRGSAPAAAPRAPRLDLQPGEFVTVRPAEEILATLDGNRKNRGLALEPEMLRHCGKTYRVLARVGRIIDERSGRMIRLANDCVMLDGVFCHGLDTRQRIFCPRGPLFYWREAWLTRADGPAGNAAD